MTAVLTAARRGHPGLYRFAIAMTALSVVLVGLAAVDHRTLLGAPLWFKPLKFAISLAAYGAALAWMLGQLRKPALRRTGWVIVLAGTIEIAIIVWQAAHGVRSHFNTDNPTSALLYELMGVTVGVLWLATLAIAVRFLREPGRDPAAGLAIRLGLGVGLVGMAVGIIMSVHGAHAVGVPDGGPGLPFAGWSTTGGDLRVAHFAGMHALQLIPLLAAGLAAFTGNRFDARGRRQIVLAVSGGYLALVLLLTWQALRAQPVLAPDGPTITALAVILAATGAGIATARRRVVVRP